MSEAGIIALNIPIRGESKRPNYMREAMFQPAGMRVSRLDDVQAIIPHRARGYVLCGREGLQNAPFVDVSNKPPGSGINSSAEDMGRFVAALLTGKLVSTRTLAEMLTPANTRDGKATIYGRGFFLGDPISRHRGLREVGHGGEQQGFSALLYLLPEEQFGVVVLSNLEGLRSTDLIDLSRKIYDTLSPN